MGFSSIIIGIKFFSLLAIVLLYLVILKSGAQSIIADRDTQHSNSLDEYKGVWQQGIIKY